tara:strand:+ start:114 stop:392 length:279 start_codon:yes stop_codon:yes gene_type:complete
MLNINKNGDLKMNDKLLNKISKVLYLSDKAQTSGGEAKIHIVIRADETHQELMRNSFTDPNKNPDDYIKVRGMSKGSDDFMTWKRDNILEVL